MNEAVWFAKYRLKDLLPLCGNNMVTHLGIDLTELGHDDLVGTCR